MCVFFCLCNTNLSHIMCCQIFSKGIVKLYLVKGYHLILDRIIIICKAYKSQIQFLLTLKAFEIIITERSCNLAGTVRTEVKEYNRIMVLNGCNRLSVFFDHSRKHEFICFFVVIGCLYSLCRVCSLYAFALGKSLVSKLYTIPAVVSVHCVITSGNNADLTYADLIHLGLQLFNISFTGSRRCITAVQEAVNVNFFQSLSLCHFQKSVKVCIMAVDTAVRKKSHKMNCRIIVLCIFHCCQKRLILKEIAVIDFFCDSCKLLIYNTSCTHIHMSDFGVAHLAVRKSYCQSACISFYKRIVCHQAVHNRSLCLIYCVAVMSVIQSITVKDHQNSWFFAHNVLLFV